MALQRMNFTKVWTNPADFPTYESQETKVRADMQLLFDELRDAHNALIDDLGANDLPFTPTEAIDETTVQAAIENVQRQIAETVAGAIPDDSLSGDKLIEGAIDTRELADYAVTLLKMSEDSVDHPQLCDDAVWGNNIKDGEITDEKIAPNALQNKADLDNGILRRSEKRLRLATPEITNGYTLLISDAETALYLTNAAAGTITIPANANAAISVGAMITLVCAGEQVTVTPASGVSLLTLGASASGDIVIAKKYTVALLFKIAENTWFALIPGVRDGEVGEADLADNAVTRNKVENGEIVYGKLGPAAVHTEELNDGAVTPAKTTGIQKAIKKATPTLLGGETNWLNNTQAVTVADMTAASEFTAAPNTATGWAAAADCMLFPPVAGAGKLTFTCDSIPDDDIPLTIYFWED